MEIVLPPCNNCGDCVSVCPEEKIIEPQKIDGSVSFYISYAKDIADALIQTGKWNEAYDLNEICERIVDAGIKMYRKIDRFPER